MKPPLLFSDDSWLVVNKPTGLSSHASQAGGQGLVEWLQLHLGHSLHLCSRLDKGTSGLILLARDASASALAQEIHGRGGAEKIYHLVSRQPGPGPAWQEDAPLDGKACTTRFRLLAKGHGHYLHEAVISRGRTHQIRRHAARAGIPIVGDGDYGGAPFPRLCLHCQKIRWPGLPELVAPAPDSFGLLLAGRSGLELEAALAWERRLAWPLLVGDCLRLVHRGELSELPLSIDLYGPCLIISYFGEERSHSLQEKLAPLLTYLGSKVKWDSLVLRSQGVNPHGGRLVRGDLVWQGAVPEEEVVVAEHGLRYVINPQGREHLGLFLDQRDSRRRVALATKDKRVANLFAFSCSFSLAAVAAGAEVVFSVDLAASALARGKENFALNGLDQGGRGKFIREDVTKWLARQLRKKEREKGSFVPWDLIICDPPVFASAGKGRTFQVEREWPRLAKQVREILAPRGAALFANNHRAGSSS
ncbi:MAG: class I SAM-dependent methyltransferase, partial [Thermodesulfobacteriota bacterium]